MGKSSSIGLCVLMLLGAGLHGAEVATVELWCVAKNNAADSALQAALDWACGAGGADCWPIQQGGLCFDPGDVQSMASYAFNAYFLKNSMVNTAATSTTPPPSPPSTPVMISVNSHPACLAVSNGTMPSPSTAGTVGLGPSEDMSGGYRQIPNHRFFWPLFFSSVLVFCTSYLVGHTL